MPQECAWGGLIVETPAGVTMHYISLYYNILYYVLQTQPYDIAIYRCICNKVERGPLQTERARERKSERRERERERGERERESESVSG